MCGGGLSSYLHFSSASRMSPTKKAGFREGTLIEREFCLWCLNAKDNAASNSLASSKWLFIFP